MVAIQQKQNCFFKKMLQKFFLPDQQNFLFLEVSKSKSITPAKFQLDRFITVGGVDGQTHKQTYPALT